MRIGVPIGMVGGVDTGRCCEYPLVPERILVDTGGIPGEGHLGHFLQHWNNFFTNGRTKVRFFASVIETGRPKVQHWNNFFTNGRTRVQHWNNFFTNGRTRVQHWNNFFANLRTEVLEKLHFCDTTRTLRVSSLKNIS